MKSAARFMAVVVFSLLSTIPGHGQGESCLEVLNYWSDKTRHSVNLETGVVTTYDGEIARQPGVAAQNSPDGRYTYVRQTGTGLGLQRLSLIDNHTGTSVRLSEHVRGSIYWSADSQWLAYAEMDETQTLMLKLYHLATAEFLSIPLITTTEPVFLMGLAWSPDYNRIAVSYEPSPGGLIQLEIYTVPDLTLTQRYESAWSMFTLLWSPSGRYLAITGTTNDVGIIDTTAQAFHTLSLDAFSNLHPQWAGDEKYLVVYYTESDFYDTYVFIDIDGKIVLDGLPVMLPVEWVNEQTILAQLWTETGINELRLINLQTGEQRLLVTRITHYDLSADRRFLATWGSDPGSGSSDEYRIQFFDVTTMAATPISELLLDSSFSNFIWNPSALEVIVLFPDRSMRGYNFETHEWRTIATIPGDEWGLQPITCQS